ncbi:MAG: DinB family protein [Chitinophagaceae bacterium]|jgi:uncharacterized damage-inducible protein DinB|nr:DinB family protein [Chitinophagaceae bacterium]
MFHSLDEFFSVWETESANTLKIFSHLTDASLQQAVVPGGRTLGRLANHLIETLTEMPHKLGLGIAEEQPAYTTVQELTAHFERCNRQMTDAIRQHWNDASLQQEIMLYGEPWKNSFSLWVILVHMIHHRAQMTVLMRQAGLMVPGIYGPAKEEWAAMHLPAME